MSKNLGDAFVRVRPDADGFEGEAQHSIGGVLKKVAAGAAAVFAAAKVKDFLVDATKGYRDHQKIAAITAQAIKTTGGAAKISAAGVGALADAIERKTGVDGDAIQSASNLLLTFTSVRNEVGKGNQIFNRATGLVADMSVALGQSAKGSAIQLGKALNDPIKGVTALSKVGVSFTEQQKAQIKTLVESGNVLGAQKVILKELGKEFGGAAKAAADPADRATAAYHQLQDQVGSVTLPVMQKLAAVFADKVAPPLLALAEKVLPKVRRGLLSAIDGIDFSSITTKLGALQNIDMGGGAGKVKGFGDALRGIGGVLKQVDFSAVARSAGDLGDAFKKLGPSLQQVSVDQTNQTLSVFAVVSKFAAEHTDLLAKALPFLAGGFIAVKVAQAAANAAALVALPTKILEVVVNRQLVKSNRELVASRQLGAVATTEATAAENVSVLTRVRSAIATVATTVAQKAASVAARAWAVAQWLLNAAMTANPIGLVVVAVAALVGGLILAYKKSETFRNIVNGAFAVVKNVVGAVVGWLGKYVPQVFAFVVGAVKAYIGVYRAVIVTAFNVVRSVISTVMNVVRSVVSGTWNGIKNVTSGAVNGIVNVVKSVPAKIRALGGAFLAAGRSIIGALVNGLKNAGGMIGGIAGNVWNAVRGLLNGAIGKINAALEFKISLPGPDISINPPNIPMLATGARVTRPTLAMIGDGREPETVMNDTMLEKALARAALAGASFGGGGGQGRAPLHFHGITEPEAVAREVVRHEAFAGAI